MGWRRESDMGALALLGGTPVRREPFPWPVHGEAERRHLLDTLASGKWSFDGPRESAFADGFARYLAASHVIPVSSGTVALEIAVRALGIGPGDEVILPALTWTAPARAIAIAGAAPVFVDVGADDWCLDPAAVEAAVTDRTRAILVVHTYSQVADMDRLLAIAVARDLAVVEDCAHAVGSCWRGRRVGTLGHVGCFSFQQSKALTAGEGGAVVTSDPHVADRAYALKNCGRARRPGGPVGFGGNHRLTEFQAAVLLGQLDRLDEQRATRARNRRLLADLLRGFPAVTPLPVRPEASEPNLFALALRVDTRAFASRSTSDLVVALAAEGIPFFLPHDVVYRSPMWRSGAREPFVAGGDVDVLLGLRARCAIAERVSGQTGVVLAHEALLGTPADVTQIVQALRKVQRHAALIPANVVDTRRI